MYPVISLPQYFDKCPNGGSSSQLLFPCSHRCYINHYPCASNYDPRRRFVQAHTDVLFKVLVQSPIDRYHSIHIPLDRAEPNTWIDITVQITALDHLPVSEFDKEYYSQRIPLWHYNPELSLSKSSGFGHPVVVLRWKAEAQTLQKVCS